MGSLNNIVIIESPPEWENLTGLTGQEKQDLNNEDICILHGALPFIYWCINCQKGLCRICDSDHTINHPTTSTSTSTSPHILISMNELNSEKTAKIHTTSIQISKLLNDAYSLDNKKQNIILKLIESINNIKSDLELELMNGNLQCLDYTEVHTLIKKSRQITFTSYKNLITLENKLTTTKSILENYIFSTQLNPFSLLFDSTTFTTNHESYKLIYNYLNSKFKNENNYKIIQNPIINVNYPKYFIDMEIGGNLMGRVIIVTRPDIAPKMCENFKLLINAEKGIGYKGCTIFQCWKRESVITGDFEYNNGRGGYSIFNKNLFLPEDTKLISSRGAIGMRRTQKRHDSKGLVGSQFRIILQDMPGFTGIFGHVLNGLNIIDKISEYGDSSGNPTIKIGIFDCGEL